MAYQNLYRSVVLKKSEVPGMINDILEACSEDVEIDDPDVYIMMRVENDLSDEEFDQHANPVTFTSASFPNIEYIVGSAKGNPPGSNSL